MSKENFLSTLQLVKNAMKELQLAQYLTQEEKYYLFQYVHHEANLYLNEALDPGISSNLINELTPTEIETVIGEQNDSNSHTESASGKPQC